MKTAWAAVLAASCLISAYAGPDSLPAAFPYLKELTAPARTAGTIGVFALDEDILAATDDAFSNMRVLASDKRETPFLVRVRRVNREIETECSVEVGQSDFKILPDNRIEILLARRMKDPPEPDPVFVEFSTRAADFEKQVSVEGRIRGGEWRSLAKERPIFDYSRYMNVRNRRVDIVAGPYDEYRIVIDRISESHQSPLTQIMSETQRGSTNREVETKSLERKDFRIEGVRFAGYSRQKVNAEPVQRGYTVSDLATEANVKTKETIVTFRTFRAPLHSLHLSTRTANFSRPVRIEGCVTNAGSATENWVSLAGTSVSRVQVGSFRQENLSIELPRECRYERYRLTIANGDSPTLDIAAIEATGVVCEAVFFTDMPGPFRAYYGAGTVTPPRYDIGPVVQKAGAESLDTFTPGPQAANSAYAPARTPRMRGRNLLAVAVVLMVVTLGWLIVKALRTIEPPAPAS